MTNAEKMELIGKILQKAGSLGDAELAGMLGELMVVTSEENAAEAAANTAGGASADLYVMCVEATLPDGSKVQHPYVGATSFPNTVDDIQMVAGTDLLALQQDNQLMAHAIENAMGVHVRYVPVSNETYAELERRLHDLLHRLSDAIDEAAEKKAEVYGLMNVHMDVDDIPKDMLQDVLSKTMYAGTAIAADGSCVERNGEEYEEEKRIRENRQEESYEDDGYDDEEPYEDDEDGEDGEED